MKRILITGANSYIGTSFEKYITENHPNDYSIDTLDMMDSKWKEYDFSKYDVVFHVAGIAHADVGHVSEDTKKLYYKVNTDLTVKTAHKAKESGVKQFIYMSSIIVYGESAPIGKKKIITFETEPSPQNFYGDSKLQADIKLQSMNDESFKVCILRPPMIYGPGCKGNYQMLSKLAVKLPIFPNIKNERSMLYIGNLVEFIRLVIKNEEQGIFFPQNKEYSNTAELVKIISVENGKNIMLISGGIWILKICSLITGLINKAFGSLIYDMNLSEYKENYRKFSLKESIKNIEEIK